ncbi:MULTISPECIES: hypothetical protein [unclassified Acinetobacter]|uniref:hypothetical protein n=1 Tax=unclassified Acinetobacter TaxID=196816 RepID=UPI00244AFBCF|nr:MULTISPECIES: hypothetical protein [unclassified Acinetobacter]MDH0033110.1 hypothetical protein [Acinetobacter sp. GD04021]MDH0888463.1 hypothetical protein [Acinetobacter sp. GD03873]MDH1084862.1 hypothetical protein [Acinetobacter sp. GD03983]MDH2191750.1 hypothetical protein [Acinetobacter sp. GD03645]MDH2205387.1 hypothetical protein [Acinetobacter sp. GD03647]
MSNYIPPDSHNVDLNFNEVAGIVDGHNVVLNFGANEVITASIDAVVATAFIPEITTLQGSVAQIDCVIATDFNAEITAVVSNQFCSVDAVIHAAFSSSINTHFDINFVLGLNHLSVFSYQKALPALIESHVRYGKARFKAHNSAFIFERGLTLSNAVTAGFDKATFLQQSVKSVFEESTKLSSDYQIVWQENDKRFIARTLVFEEAEKLLINRETDWDEMIRKRRKFTFSHEVAEVFEKRFTFRHDKGLELVTTDSIPWEVARAVYYRKSKVDPIEPQPKPEYVGSTDLNFICLCHDIDSHNVVLNFGADDCIPSLAPVDWWYIVNDLKVTRLDNGQEIQVNNGDYRCDRGSWCWSYNLTIPFYEKSKLDPVDGQPVILKILINGNEHRMLLENISRSRQFAKDVYKLSGRSPTALLDAPYSPTRSFTQENERTSVQLVQAELDRVSSDIVLNWQLIDALGWVLPANSLSYSNLTPIAAIKLIADAAGGFIYSEPDSNTLTIKPLYKKTFWDAIDIAEYDRVIPESLVTDLSTDYAMYPDYNGVFLTNDRNGDTGQVKRVGTAGDVLQESINNPLLTSVSAMHEKGRAVLAKAGMVESHSLLMPVSAQVGLCTPGELIAFNADWWGVGDGVSGSFSHDVVNQTVSVERVNRE